MIYHSIDVYAIKSLQLPTAIYADNNQYGNIISCQMYVTTTKRPQRLSTSKMYLFVEKESDCQLKDG